MNSTLKKLYQKLAFYLRHPFQASVYTAFNVFLGVFQPVPIGVKLCQKPNRFNLQHTPVIPNLT